MADRGGGLELVGHRLNVEVVQMLAWSGPELATLDVGQLDMNWPS